MEIDSLMKDIPLNQETQCVFGDTMEESGMGEETITRKVD